MRRYALYRVPVLVSPCFPLRCDAVSSFPPTEDELKEKQRLEHLAERRLCDVNRDAASIRLNNVSRAEECHPPPVPPSLPPPSITVVTVVAPGDTLSPPAAAILPRPPQPKPDHSPTSVPTANHKQLMQNQNQHHQNQHQQRLIVQTNNTKLQTQLLHRYPGAIVSPPQQLALLPQPGPVVQQAPPPPPLQNGPISRGSPPDDGRQLDRKRPGGYVDALVYIITTNRVQFLSICSFFFSFLIYTGV